MANKFSKNDEAVSAVIGVILMVAITVILAAVIAAFVFGMGSSIKKTYTVSFTVDRTSNGDIIITNTGGPDVGKLVPGSVNVSYVATDGTVVAPAPIANLDETVGSSCLIATADAHQPSHVTVSAKFQDGSSAVLTTADV